MTTPTPRTDATLKAIVAMMEPLRGGTRVTDAEMRAIDGLITAMAKCAIDLERDLAAAQERAEKAEAERDEIKAMLQSVSDEIDDDKRQAPGHCHTRPGIWDDDNGDRSGTKCAWCALWRRIRAALRAATKETP